VSSAPAGGGRGRAGGKIILLGEHVVVYGRPAIAAGLSCGLEAEVVREAGPRLESDRRGANDERGRALVERAAALVGVDPRGVVVRVRSELPVGRGFGSSAALAVATLRALAAAAGRALSEEDELGWGRELEAIFHGNPSGIDPAAAALGTCFRFVRGEPPSVVPLRPARPIDLVVLFDDRPRSTGEVVRGLRARREAEPDRHERLFDEVATVVDAGERALLSGDVAGLGSAFDENHRLLAVLGVSSADTDALVSAARRAGARGAKLTGGGAGGAVIALADDPEAAARLAASVAGAGVHVMTASIGR